MIKDSFRQLDGGEQITVDGTGIDADAISPDQGGGKREVTEDYHRLRRWFEIPLPAKSPAGQQLGLDAASLHAILARF